MNIKNTCDGHHKLMHESDTIYYQLSVQAVGKVSKQDGGAPVQTAGRRLYKKRNHHHQTLQKHWGNDYTLNATDRQGSEAGWSWGCW